MGHVRNQPLREGWIDPPRPLPWECLGLALAVSTSEPPFPAARQICSMAREDTQNTTRRALPDIFFVIVPTTAEGQLASLFVGISYLALTWQAPQEHQGLAGSQDATRAQSGWVSNHGRQAQLERCRQCTAGNRATLGRPMAWAGTLKNSGGAARVDTRSGLFATGQVRRRALLPLRQFGPGRVRTRLAARRWDEKSVGGLRSAEGRSVVVLSRARIRFPTSGFDFFRGDGRSVDQTLIAASTREKEVFCCDVPWPRPVCQTDSRRTGPRDPGHLTV